jgi:hypothetical protein
MGRMTQSTYLEKRFVKQSSVVSRQIAGESILVPIRQRAGEVESIYTLNEVAARIWELLDGERDIGTICHMIVAEFEVDPAEVETDVVEFIQQLAHAGVVREV